MTRSISILWMLLALFITACNSSADGTSDNSQQENTETDTEGEAQEQDYQANETLIAWVDLLNVRAEPNTSGEIVASLRENAVVKYMGERTDDLQTIALRGTSFEAPWLKIRTADGKEGWVFGGAVQREGENKGVERSTMTVGELANLEMSQWIKITEWGSGAGDSESTHTLYKRGDLTLVIIKTAVSEYGYGTTYDLYNASYNLIKNRQLIWSSDPKFTLTETITDLESYPPKTHTRSQTFKQHFFQLKPTPESVEGEFVIGTLEETEANKFRQTILLQPFVYKDWPSSMDQEGGCSCIFELIDFGETDMIFASDMGDNATIKANGKMISLKDDMQAHLAQLKQRAAQEVWINLKEKGADELFGEPLNSSGDWQQDILNTLKEVMMVMDKIPTEPRIKSIGTVGMGHRGNIRDLWNDAVQEVKAIKSNGDDLKLRYAGGGYICVIKARQTSVNDGGGGKYEGFMEILSKEGISLNNRYVYGDCGC